MRVVRVRRVSPPPPSFLGGSPPRPPSKGRWYIPSDSKRLKGAREGEPHRSEPDLCARRISNEPGSTALPAAGGSETRTQPAPHEMEQTEVLKPRTLADLIRILHRLFAGDEVNVEEVQAIMEAYESDPTEWAMYAKFDQYRYTRNLVDQGNGKFNLMILCWGEGHGSSIHDHTNSHCFLKMLQGNLKETLFAWPDKKSNEMVKKSERVLRENQCAYINDSIGLHRVENISHTEPAVSLHLYSPPFDTCHAFDQRTGHKNKVTMTFHSKFGIRTPYATSGSLENN
uniref:Cysteine dioxygenase n=7 Tax=Cercopithecinae TaxID=9528 RepID=A0A5F8AAE6_MACMU